MENKSRILNLISILSLLLLALLYALIIVDSPLSWKLFPGDSVLFFPLLFLIPLVLSVVSLRGKKSALPKITLSISIVFLIITGLWALYIFALGTMAF